MPVQNSHLLQALENERRYIARELHDEVAQTTLQLGLQIGICQKLLERGMAEMLTDELAQLEERIQLASRQVREMIADMRPPKVEDEATLNDYLRFVIEIHQERGGTPVDYELNSKSYSDLSTEVSLTLARVVQEILLNTRKHAEASNIRLTVTEQDKAYEVVVADNGKGFDLMEVQSRPVDKGGAGLANLRARVAAIGGTLEISTGPNSNGTMVSINLPK